MDISCLADFLSVEKTRKIEKAVCEYLFERIGEYTSNYKRQIMILLITIVVFFSKITYNKR